MFPQVIEESQSNLHDVAMLGNELSDTAFSTFLKNKHWQKN